MIYWQDGVKLCFRSASSLDIRVFFSIILSSSVLSLCKRITVNKFDSSYEVVDYVNNNIKFIESGFHCFKSTRIVAKHLDIMCVSQLDHQWHRQYVCHVNGAKPSSPDVLLISIEDAHFQ